MTGLVLALATTLVVACCLGPVLRRLPVPDDDPAPDFVSLATPAFMVGTTVAVLIGGLVAAVSDRPWLWLPLTLPLIPACAIDARTTYLPLRLTQGGWALAAVTIGATALATRDAGVGVRAIVAATVVGSAFWLAWRLRMLGFGDVRLMLTVAAVCAAFSWRLLATAVLFGALIGGLAGLVQIARGRGSGAFPYGPSLLAGPFVAAAVETLTRAT